MRVSWVVGTHRPEFMENIFANLERQTYSDIELILMLHGDAVKEKLWLYLGRTGGDENIIPILVDKKKNFAEVYDYGIQMASSDYVLTMDHDDYYGPKYVENQIEGILTHGVDIVGKAAFFIYMKSAQTLLIHHKERVNINANHIKGEAGRLAGGTLCFKKKVADKAKFYESEKVRIGDGCFQRACGRNGFSFFSLDQWNYVYIRYGENTGHAWEIKDWKLLDWNEFVAKTDDFVPYITR